MSRRGSRAAPFSSSDAERFIEHLLDGDTDGVYEWVAAHVTTREEVVQFLTFTAFYGAEIFAVELGVTKAKGRGEIEFANLSSVGTRKSQQTALQLFSGALDPDKESGEATIRGIVTAVVSTWPEEALGGIVVGMVALLCDLLNSLARRVAA